MLKRVGVEKIVVCIGSLCVEKMCGLHHLIRRQWVGVE